jgi:formylglycine-generating enzyme required for sulfatase activity
MPTQLISIHQHGRDVLGRRRQRIHLAAAVAVAGAVLAGLTGCGGRSASLIGASECTVEVQANQTWQDTGVDVSPGAPVWLTPEGKWKRDGNSAPATGLNEAPADLAVLPNAPLMCVLVRVGDDEPQALTQAQGLLSKKEGRLFVQANDLELISNSGSVALRIDGGIAGAGAVPAPPLLPAQVLEREYQALREKAIAAEPDAARDLVFAFCAKHLGERHARRAATEILSQVPSLVNSIGMRFRPIPPGRFTMGDAELAECPPHEVTLTRPYYLGAHEVTIGEFRRFVSATGHRTDAEKEGWSQRYFAPSADWLPDRKANWKNPGFAHTDEHPVVHISWNDAVAFCAWLSKKDGHKYRLPTEAEWEYACRAGSTTPFFWGEDEPSARKYANTADASLKSIYPGWHYHINDWDDGHANTSPVGSFRPNTWGLYDMSGNAWEWCADWFGRDYYLKSPAVNPLGPASGGSRVLRGGSWALEIGYARSGFRQGIHTPNSHNALLGFRVVRVIPTEEKR